MTALVLALCDRLYAASEALASAAARRGEDEFARRVTAYLDLMATLRSEIVASLSELVGIAINISARERDNNTETARARRMVRRGGLRLRSECQGQRPACPLQRREDRDDCGTRSPHR